MPKIARADTVGSLLRPPYLTEARQGLRAGTVTPEQLREVEDRAIREAIAYQENIGLDVITDGEFRRNSWIATAPLIADPYHKYPLGGFSMLPVQQAWMTTWRDATGQLSSPMGAQIRPRGIITEKLRVEKDMLDDEYRFLKANTRSRTKYCLPAPSYHRVFWDKDHSKDAYASPEEFMVAVAQYIRDQVVKPLVDLGCDYIQMDAPNYGQFYTDPMVRGLIEAEGHDLEKDIAADAEIDNMVFEGISDVTRAIHVCRGNAPGGRWSAAGGYEPVARDLFPRLTNYDTLLLEYDTDRAGDFAPMRHVQPHQVVVLGLLTTKNGKLEDQGAVEARIKEATQYVPMGQIALSTQCGFASVDVGNPITPAEQDAKLEMVVRLAHKLWP